MPWNIRVQPSAGLCCLMVTSEYIIPEQVLGTGELLATTTRFLNTRANSDRNIHLPTLRGYPVSTGNKWKSLLDTGSGYTGELPLKSWETTITES